MTVDTSVRRKSRAIKVNALAFCLMCKLMMDGTRTCAELAEETGLHVLTVYDWTRAMHKQGIIHICMWEGEGRSSTRIFMFGPGKDAPRPIKKRSVISAEYRARKQAAHMLQMMAGAA